MSKSEKQKDKKKNPNKAKKALQLDLKELKRLFGGTLPLRGNCKPHTN